MCTCILFFRSMLRGHMAHPNPAPPDSNGPSAARSYREREGTGLLCVTAHSTRGYLRPHWLQEHICTLESYPQLQMATDQNCAATGRVWWAEVAGEWPMVAELRWSCIIHWKLAHTGHLVDCSAAAAANPCERASESEPGKHTCGRDPKGMSEKEIKP